MMTTETTSQSFVSLRGLAGTLGAAWLLATSPLYAQVAPAISSQPQGRTSGVGTTATFSVTATGTAPLAYQWRKAGTNLADGGRLSGVGTASLTNSSVRSADAGNHTVVITNMAGSVVVARRPAGQQMWPEGQLTHCEQFRLAGPVIKSFHNAKSEAAGTPVFALMVADVFHAPEALPTYGGFMS